MTAAASGDASIASSSMRGSAIRRYACSITSALSIVCGQCRGAPRARTRGRWACPSAASAWASSCHDARAPWAACTRVPPRPEELQQGSQQNHSEGSHDVVVHNHPLLLEQHADRRPDHQEQGIRNV
eukprot:3268158-Rhodomonas_salina.4